jgi:hypothetical protein
LICEWIRSTYFDNEFLETWLGKIKNEGEKLEAQLNEALELREDHSKPLEIDNIKLTIEKLLKVFYKLTGTQKRRMVEQILYLLEWKKSLLIKV